MHTIASVHCTHELVMLQSSKVSHWGAGGTAAIWRTSGSSESEGVLHSAGKLGFGLVETQAADFILCPTLAKDEEHIIAWPQSPADAALPAEVRLLICRTGRG